MSELTSEDHCSFLYIFSIEYNISAKENINNVFMNERNLLITKFISKILSIAILFIFFIYFFFFKYRRNTLKNEIKESIFIFLENVIEDLKIYNHHAVEIPLLICSKKSDNKQSEYFSNSSPFDRFSINEERKEDIFELSYPKIPLLSENRRSPDSKENLNDFQNDDNFQNPAETTFQSQKIVYICNFSTCCLGCLPTFLRDLFNERIKKPLKKKTAKLRNYLLDNISQISFITLSFGSWIVLPLKNILLLLINDCLELNVGKDIFQFFVISFFILDSMCSYIFFFNNLFLVSFISTRREILTVESNKKLRGYLLYYHIKKALLLAFLMTLVKILLRLIYYNEKEKSYYDSDYFLFNFFARLFLFCFIGSYFKNLIKTNLIQNCDNVLKSKHKYYLIKNIITKYMPNIQTYYTLIKKSVKENSQQNAAIIFLNTKIEKDLENSQKNLFDGLKIIEAQKYKNILRNRGITPWIPLGFIWYVCFENFFFICIYSIIYFVIKYQKFEVFFELMEIIEIWKIVNFLFMPFLISLNLQKKVFFFDEENF